MAYLVQQLSKLLGARGGIGGQPLELENHRVGRIDLQVGGHPAHPAHHVVVALGGSLCLHESLHLRRHAPLRLDKGGRGGGQSRRHLHLVHFAAKRLLDELARVAELLLSRFILSGGVGNGWREGCGRRGGGIDAGRRWAGAQWRSCGRAWGPGGRRCAVCFTPMMTGNQRCYRPSPVPKPASPTPAAPSSPSPSLRHSSHPSPHSPSTHRSRRSP